MVIVFVFMTKIWSDQQDAKMIHQYSQDKKVLVNRILELESVAVDHMLKDYGVWVDLVKFVDHPDKLWAKENVDTVLEAYGLEALWVIKADGTVVYQSSRDKSYPNWNPISKNEALIASTGIDRFYSWTKLGLEEIRVTKLDQSQVPGSSRAFYVTSKLFSDQRLQELSNVTDCQVSILKSDPKETRMGGVEPKFHHVLSLSDISSQPIAWLNLSASSALLERLQSKANLALIQLVGSLTILGGVLFAMLRNTVSISRKVLDEAARTQSAEAIAKLASSNSELEQLSSLVATKNEQDELRKLNLELEAKFNKKTKELQRASTQILSALLESIVANPESLSLKQRQTIELSQGFAKHLGRGASSLKDLQKGMILSFFVENSQPEDIAWIDTESLYQNQEFSRILSVCKLPQNSWVHQAIEPSTDTRIFHICHQWVLAWPGADLNNDKVWESTVSNLRTNLGPTSDPGLTTRFLKFVRTDAIGLESVA